MDRFASFQDVIAAWPGPTEMGKDIGVTPMHVNSMRIRDSIPPRYWGQLVAAASRRGIPVNLETLSALAMEKVLAKADMRPIRTNCDTGDETKGAAA